MEPGLCLYGLPVLASSRPTRGGSLFCFYAFSKRSVGTEWAKQVLGVASEEQLKDTTYLVS